MFQLYRRYAGSGGTAWYGGNSPGRSYRQTGEGGCRSDEYPFQTGGLPDGSAGVAWSDGGTGAGAGEENHELYYHHRGTGDFKRSRSIGRCDGICDGKNGAGADPSRRKATETGRDHVL